MNWQQRRLIIIPLAIMALLNSTGCDNHQPEERAKTQLEQAVEQTIDKVIVPAAIQFAEEATQLNNVTANFCESTMQPAQLLIAQEQWKRTLNAWYRLSPFIFGPAINHPVFETWLYIDSYRKSHEDNRGKIQLDIKTMTSTVQAVTQEQIAQKGFSYVGLPALEVILFDSPSGNSTTSIANEFKQQKNRCEILKGYSAELSRRANIVSQGWTHNYRNTGQSYRALLLGGQLDIVLDDESGKEPATYLFDALAQYYDYVNKRELSTNIAPLAGNFWEAYKHSLVSTKNALEGTKDTTVSFSDIMIASEGMSELAALKNSLEIHEKAINTKDSALLKASAKNIDKNFKNEVAFTLGISVGIGFTDGD